MELTQQYPIMIHWTIVLPNHTVYFNYFSLYFLFVCISYPGTHTAGIIAANTTGINETIFIPKMPFIGVAPQVTLGACKFT
jgi:hypothetical protein